MDDDECVKLVGNSSGHAVKLKELLYDQMLTQSEFCDVTLKFSGMEMKAHWCVLVSCPYFSSAYMYNHGQTGYKQDTDTVNISVGKASAIRLAITFLYTGTVEMKGSMLKDLLEVADYLQIDDLKIACANYLPRIYITVDNCLYFCLLASTYELDYYNQVIDFVKGHLPEVLQQPLALDLEGDSVLDFIVDPTLSYVTRTDLFNFIIKWLQKDKENRMGHFENMFCELDLKKIPTSFLESVIEMCEYVSSSERCKVHLLDVKMKRLAGLLSTDENDDVILVAGGYGEPFAPHFFALPFPQKSGREAVTNLYAYVVAENRWAELAPLPISMSRPLIAFSEPTKCLYVFSPGADSLEGNEATVHKYDLMGKAWSTVHLTLPEPIQTTAIHDLVIVGNSPYMVASGYSSGESRKGQQEKLCIIGVKNDMTHCYKFFSPCVSNIETQVKVCVLADRYICILGYGSRARFFMYDTHSLMNKEYSRGATFDKEMFTVGEEVYVTKIGGNMCKKFSLSTRRWTSVGETIFPKQTSMKREEAALCVFKDQVFMIGGRDEDKLIDNTSVYEFPSGVWKDVARLPRLLSPGAVLPARIPANSMRCHINCPHCRFVSPRSQASYARVDLPEDEDLELTSDDEVYSHYSDPWYNDVYDDLDIYPDYDWF